MNMSLRKLSGFLVGGLFLSASVCATPRFEIPEKVQLATYTVAQDEIVTVPLHNLTGAVAKLQKVWTHCGCTSVVSSPSLIDPGTTAIVVLRLSPHTFGEGEHSSVVRFYLMDESGAKLERETTLEYTFRFDYELPGQVAAYIATADCGQKAYLGDLVITHRHPLNCKDIDLEIYSAAPIMDPDANQLVYRCLESSSSLTFKVQIPPEDVQRRGGRLALVVKSSVPALAGRQVRIVVPDGLPIEAKPAIVRHVGGVEATRLITLRSLLGALEVESVSSSGALKVIPRIDLATTGSCVYQIYLPVVQNPTSESVSFSLRKPIGTNVRIPIEMLP